MDIGQAKDICKLGQAEDCCRYLMVGGNGFECAKLTSLKADIDEKVKAGKFNAQGDNCDGREN